jgi:hypothetical protein
MGGPAQVGAFAVGARTGAVVKHVDVAGIWRILLRVWFGRPRVAD